MSESEMVLQQLAEQPAESPQSTAGLSGGEQGSAECSYELTPTACDGPGLQGSDSRTSSDEVALDRTARIPGHAVPARARSVLGRLLARAETAPQSTVVSALPAGDERTRAEEMKLVQRVFLPRIEPAPQVVVFSGVDHANGCTWICAQAAETLATLAKGDVCVVDANFRTPSLCSYFGLRNNNKGLAEAATDSPSRSIDVHYLAEHNLSVLTTGGIPSDPEALLASDGLRECIAKLRASFDYVLIDTPPLAHFADAYLMGGIADGIVLIVEANSTRRETAGKVKESLEAAQIPILAVVLNKWTSHIPDAVYRYL